MQINRLLEMVYILLNKKTITAKELAQHFEVSVRTIYRDIDLLSSSRIPVYTNKGKNGGICLLDNFLLEKSVLSEQEQQEILSSVQALQSLKESKEETILKRLGDIFHQETENWIMVDFSSWGKNGQNNENFTKIKQAILQKRILTFSYVNNRAEESKRKVEPIQIWFKDKSWYLFAYCLEKEQMRTFKITRMREIRIEEEHFDVRRKKEISMEEAKTQRLVEIEILVKERLSYRIYDEFDEQSVQKLQNGDYRITVTYPEDEWLYGYLLSFGEDMKIIKPEYMKERIKQKLRKALENYKEGK